MNQAEIIGLLGIVILVLVLIIASGVILQLRAADWKNTTEWAENRTMMEINNSQRGILFYVPVFNGTENVVYPMITAFDCQAIIQTMTGGTP